MVGWIGEWMERGRLDDSMDARIDELMDAAESG